MMLRLSSFGFLLSSFIVASSSSLVLSNIHGDSQVLQSTAPILIAFTTPGALINASISTNGASAAATADASGRAVIVLPPQAAGGPADIALASSDGGAAVLRDVLFGDVFFCAGEGMLAVTLAGALNASREISRANLYSAGIRLFAAAPATADVPAAQLTVPPLLPWQPASAAAVGGANWSHFSAACWVMGREIFDALGGAVPIGLVQATFGGATFAAAFPEVWYPNATTVCGAAPEPSSGAPRFGTMANAMVYPFFPEPPLGQPTAFKGTIWAFGESSVPPRATDADIDFFRCIWILDAAPVNTANIWPQVGPLSAPAWTDGVARVRDAQRDGTVGTERWEAVIGTADLGDAASPFTAPYLRDQAAVGRRFAAAFLGLAYGHSAPAYIGPRAAAAAVTAASNASAVVTVTVAFEPASVASGLVYTPASCPPGVPHDGPNDAAGSSVCVGWRVLSGRSAFPPPPVYAPQAPGFIGAGNDLPGSGVMTVAQAEAACTADLSCVGFTFESASATCGGGACNVYLKSVYSFSPAAGWVTYNSSRAPVGRWYDADSVAVSADGKHVVVTATLPNAGDTVRALAYGYAPWPLHSLANGAGLPALPFNINVAPPAAAAARRLQLQPWLALQPLAYTPLPLGAVMPAGWLAAQLEVAVSGMSGWLHEFYGPVRLSPWISDCATAPPSCEDTNEGEDFAYWFAAAVPLAHLSRSARLLADVSRFVDHILATQAPSGWLGPPIADADGNGEWARWPVLAGLLQWREATADARILPAVLAHLRESFRRRTTVGPLGGNWAGSRWQDYAYVVEWVIDLAGGGGDAEWLTDLLWTIYGQQTVDWEAWYTPAFFPKGNTGWNLSAHGVNSAQSLKSGAVVYRMSGSRSAAQSSFDRLALLDKYHGAPTGVFQADETLSDSMPSHGTELCAVVESIFSLNVVHEVQGDASFADRAERIAYNALPGTWTADMWGHQYLQQANAVNALHQDDHVWLADGPDATTFGLAPNYPCCTANGPQGWPRLVGRMVHATPDVGLAISILGPLVATVGGVTVAVKTEYPFGDSLDIAVTGAPPGFALYVRVPGWAATANATLNGGAAARMANGTMHRVILAGAAGGDAVHVELNPTLFVDSIAVGWNGGVAVHRGALTYGLRLGEHLNVTGTHACPAPDHPQVADFTVNSTTPWNIALVLDPAREDLSPFLRFERTGAVNMSQPFDHANPPLRITAMARQVAAWGLAHGSAAAPPASPGACAGEGACGAPFAVTLVPYGSTHLRMSVLPWTLS